MFRIPALIPNESEVTSRAIQLATKSLFTGMVELAGMAIGGVLRRLVQLENTHPAQNRF
jgi:hypothetical protein